MNRIFRGRVFHYSNDCGWVYGDFHKMYDGSLYHYITHLPDLEKDNFQTSYYNVLSDTITQSTGLKDKNGKEIFEGDILIDREITEDGTDISSHFPVVYDVKTGSYSIDNSYYKEHQHLVNMVQYFGLENLEVVGNIFDNKDLLPQRNSPNFENVKTDFPF